MNAMDKVPDNSRYARRIESSKRVRWDIDEDVIRGRRFDTAHKFLPDGLSLTDGFTTLSSGEKRFVSQIQGRTYANIFGLVERFINAKVLELSRDHALGDQMRYLLGAGLDVPLDQDQARAHHLLAEHFHHPRPHHDIGNAGLVLQRHEHHALGAARALAHQHHTGATDTTLVIGMIDLAAGDHAFA